MRWSDLKPGDVYAHWETGEATLVLDQRSADRITATGITATAMDKQIFILRLHVGQLLWMYVSADRMQPGVYEVLRRGEAA